MALSHWTPDHVIALANRESGLENGIETALNFFGLKNDDSLNSNLDALFKNKFPGMSLEEINGELFEATDMADEAEDVASDYVPRALYMAIIRPDVVGDDASSVQALEAYFQVPGSGGSVATGSLVRAMSRRYDCNPVELFRVIPRYAAMHAKCCVADRNVSLETVVQKAKASAEQQIEAKIAEAKARVDRETTAMLADVYSSFVVRYGEMTQTVISELENLVLDI